MSCRTDLADPGGGSAAGKPACDPATATCPFACKLVSLTVIRNATQSNVTGDKNWATIKSATDDVIVEATTTPSTEDCWKAIKWSGDSGNPGDTPNQRKLSRAASQRFHVEAELGGSKDFIDLWIIWATVEIRTRGSTPPSSAQFDRGMRDDTQRLGAVTYLSLMSSVIDGQFVQNLGASGKVAPVASITPPGVHNVVSAHWAFKREKWSHGWMDGNRLNPGDQRGKDWNTTWVDDTSSAAYLKLTPDGEDKIYDLDGPDIRWGTKNFEIYHNFRQWIEWNGERCSDFAGWYWQARWQVNRDPHRQVILNDLGPGSKPLPDQPFFPP